MCNIFKLFWYLDNLLNLEVKQNLKKNNIGEEVSVLK